MMIGKVRKNIFYLVTSLIVLLMFALFFLVNPVVKQYNPYLQMSSSVSQSPHEGNGVIKMESVDAKQTVDFDRNYERIFIKEEGMYFVMAAVQVGALSPIEKRGWVDVWFNLNDTQMSSSNTRYIINHQNDTSVLVSQMVQVLKAGDALSVGFSSSDAALGAVVIEAEGEPIISSIIFSLFKISEL